MFCFNIVLAILHLLHIHRYFRISSSSLLCFFSIKLSGIWVGTIWNLQINLRKINILKIFSLLIQNMEYLSICLGLLNFFSETFYSFQYTNLAHILVNLFLSISHLACYFKWYFKFFIFNCTLLVYRNTFDFCILTFTLAKFIYGTL